MLQSFQVYLLPCQKVFQRNQMQQSLQRVCSSILLSHKLCISNPLIRVKEFFVFIKCKPVCHACNIVAYKALLACIFYGGIYMGRQEFWLYRVNLEKRLKYALCLICHPYHPVMLVKVSYKKPLQASQGDTD